MVAEPWLHLTIAMAHEQQIAQLAEALQNMQGRVAAAELAASTAQQQNLQLANKLAAAEQHLMTNQTDARATTRTATLVDTRSIGKVPNFNGDRESWQEWAFQFTAYLGAANHKATAALKWAATSEVVIDESDIQLENSEYAVISSQLYLALVLMCKNQALTLIRNVGGNNGLEAWRILNAHYDPGSKGRQRVRMRQLLQPTKPTDVSNTRDAIERWEHDVREIRDEVQQGL